MFSNEHRNTAARCAGRLALSVALLSTTASVPVLATASPASATGTSAIVDSGTGWSVSEVPGGYEVDVTLTSPLPTRDDVPVLVADGTVALGRLRESSDGLTLSLTTPDNAVATAEDVFAEWSSGEPISTQSPASAPATTPAVTPQIKAAPNLAPAAAATTTPSGNPILSSDPTTPGGFSYRVADYNFGAQAQALSDIGGVRGEAQGRIYLPKGRGRIRWSSSCMVATGRVTTSGLYSPPTCGPARRAMARSTATPATTGRVRPWPATVSWWSQSARTPSTPTTTSCRPTTAWPPAGQEFLDTLSWLQKADQDRPVSFFDAQTNQTVTLDQALTVGQAAAPQTGEVTAATLVGTMDFNDIGIMGHSRGGEGAATAPSLNAGLAHPWAIKSVFELAPIDFTRDTVPDIPEATLLPYCDGDVSDQQGEDFYADSKNAFADNVLRSDIWVMGTDHDFYNQDWTPPTPGSSDDWTAGRQSATDPVCGEQATSQLPTPADQYQVGAA